MDALFEDTQSILSWAHKRIAVRKALIGRNIRATKYLPKPALSRPYLFHYGKEPMRSNIVPSFFVYPNIVLHYSTKTLQCLKLKVGLRCSCGEHLGRREEKQNWEGVAIKRGRLCSAYLVHAATFWWHRSDLTSNTSTSTA